MGDSTQDCPSTPRLIAGAQIWSTLDASSESPLRIHLSGQDALAILPKDHRLTCKFRLHIRILAFARSDLCFLHD